MLTKLTGKQKSMMPIYVEKYIKLGLSTERMDKEKSEKAIKELYRLAKLKEPKIIYCPCPMSGALSAMAIKKAFMILKEKECGSAVRSAVGSAVGSAVDSAVHSAVRSAVRSAVGSAVDSAVYSAVGSAVDSAVYSAVYSAVDSAGNSFFGGSLWIGYTAFYKFFAAECNIKIGTEAYFDLQENCGYFWTLDGIAILTDRPTEIHRNTKGQLHNESGMAIKYSSGWGLWQLNGVKVPESIVLTPAEKLNPKLVLEEKNAEVRRELVRKIGIERVVTKLGAKTIEKSSDGMYELLTLRVENAQVKDRIYLKMRNPSIPVFHIEGVPPECKTIASALNFRAGGIDLNPQFMA